MNKILSSLLKNYDRNNTEVFLKAKFILITTLFVNFAILLILFYTAWLAGMNSAVFTTELFGFAITLFALVMLVRGNYNIAIHVILIAGFSTVWGVLFSEPNISIFTKTDTIVFIIGLLAVMPLMFFKSRKPMIFYFIVNICLFFLHVFFLHKTASLTIREQLDYFFDNLVVMTFVFFISINLFSIYKQVLRSLNKELQERKHSENINKTLFAISSSVNTTLNLKNLYKQIHNLLNEILDVNNFFIAIVSEKDHTLYFPYYVDTVDEDFSPITNFDPKKSLTGLVVSKRTPMLLNQDKLKALSRGNGIWGPVPLVWMGVPLMIKDEVIGVIAVQSYTQPELYNEQDLKVLLSISDQVAIAIDRKRTEEELKESEKKYRHIFNQAPVGMYEIDFAKNQFMDVNDTFLKQTGYTREEIFSMNPLDLLTDESKQQLNKRYEKLFRGEKIPNEYEYEILGKDGQKLNIMLNNDYIYKNNKIKGARVVAHNVTERKKIESMIIQTEKMMSVGGLAAGMAHEINNPLAGVLQNINVLSNRLTNKKLPANIEAARSANTSMETIYHFMEIRNIPRMIKAITDSGSRMASIVGNMLSFARKSDSSFSAMNLGDLLDKVLDLAATDFNLQKHYDFKSILIEKVYEDNLPLIPCEGNTIQQVLLNLIKNGAYAMLEDSKTVKPKFIFRLHHERTPNMLRIEIEDNGPGMDKKTCKRIFEPFFTTKPVGIGTGLGLSVSYFIITESHKGTMTVESKPEEGSNFIIRLPVERKITKQITEPPA